MGKLSTILIVFLALAGCEYHMQPVVRGGDLDAMMRGHIAFIAENSDLEPADPPRVVWHEDMTDFARAKYGGRVDTWLIPEHQIGAAYEPSTRTIHLPERWKPYVDEEGLLVHELVHYLQDMNDRPMCRRDLEQQAYEIEALWYKANHPDEFFYMAGYQKLIPTGCD